MKGFQCIMFTTFIHRSRTIKNSSSLLIPAYCENLSLCDIRGAIYVMIAIQQKVKCWYKLEPNDNEIAYELKDWIIVYNYALNIRQNHCSYFSTKRKKKTRVSNAKYSFYINFTYIYIKYNDKYFTNYRLYGE